MNRQKLQSLEMTVDILKSQLAEIVADNERLQNSPFCSTEQISPTATASIYGDENGHFISEVTFKSHDGSVVLTVSDNSHGMSGLEAKDRCGRLYEKYMAAFESVEEASEVTVEVVGESNVHPLMNEIIEGHKP